MTVSAKARLIMAAMLLQGLGAAGWPPLHVAMAQAAAQNTLAVSDITLDKPGEVVLGTRTALSEYADVSMLLYFEFPERIPWLYFRDGTSGKTSHIRLPFYETKTVLPKAEQVLTSLKEAVTFHHGASSLLIREYALTGFPLPRSATLRSEVPFGNDDSRERSFIKLKSGGLLAVWYQQTANADKSLSLGFAYRNPRGQWSSYFPVTVGDARSALTSASIATVQHPQDDSIWVFAKRDSFRELAAVHLSETPSGLDIDWIDPRFIAKDSDGYNAPESERPDLVAVADPFRNRILLAYQGNSYSFLSTTPFVKGATVTIAEIAADGSRTYQVLPDYVERVTRLGLMVSDGKAWLAYRPINGKTLSFDELFVDSYDFATGLWEGPVLLGSLYLAANYDNRNEALAFGTHRFELAAKMDDGFIHLYRLDPPPDVTPPRVSIGYPVAGAAVAKAIEVQVSASDDVGVIRTEIYVDAERVAADDNATGRLEWDTTAWQDGVHSLKAAAFDAAGNRGASPGVSVRVQNDTTAPVVSFVSPTNGATVKETVAVSVSAEDDVGVVEMNLYVDGVLAAIETANPLVWETTLWPDGRHSLKVIALDAAGRSGSSPLVTVTVDNSAADFSGSTESRTRSTLGSAAVFIGVVCVAALLLSLFLARRRARQNPS